MPPCLLSKVSGSLQGRAGFVHGASGKLTLRVTEVSLLSKRQVLGRRGRSRSALMKQDCLERSQHIGATEDDRTLYLQSADLLGEVTLSMRFAEINAQAEGPAQDWGENQSGVPSIEGSSRWGLSPQSPGSGSLG